MGLYVLVPDCCGICRKALRLFGERLLTSPERDSGETALLLFFSDDCWCGLLVDGDGS